MTHPKPVYYEDEILPYLKYIRTKKQEYFVCISLDGTGKVLRRRTVTIGTLTSTLVHPREVFAGPIKDRAASIIIAHNHPSGETYPSDADISTTQQLVASGQLLGIRVQDHIIVSKNDIFSFHKKGYIGHF